MFLFHCCNVLFHHHFLLQSKARLSKIIPAFRVPRNLVYERDPSAVWMVMSTDVLSCAAVCAAVFSRTGCVFGSTFFCSLPSSNCQQLRYCCANGSQIAKKHLWLRGKLLLQLRNIDVVSLRALCYYLYAVIDLQCSVSWPCKKYADWSACLTWEIVWKLEIVPFSRYISQHRTVFWKEKLKVSLRPEKMLHTINEFMNKMTDKHTNKKTGALFCGN